ncbi:CD225/dispanin family protein [Intestinicryptomonas porci]|uniref:CD225/dispanin family protein n=1 Tax=Intestinicryptomonas porci TaxID=2926320 RepID=A0ABU4WI28_9BACT|nr:CD225/dispanin family protein [Opitutales bacterium CLA-KB-P66]
MYCKYCGTELPENADVCVKCGKLVSKVSKEKINNNLVLAIITTICCCLPFGIAAIVYSSKVNTFLACGNIEAAKEAANTSKKWSLWGIGLGIIFTFFYILLGALADAAK